MAIVFKQLAPGSAVVATPRWNSYTYDSAIIPPNPVADKAVVWGELTEHEVTLQWFDMESRAKRTLISSAH